MGSKFVECHSPHRVRQLLYKVLSVKDWASAEAWVSREGHESL